MKKIIIVLAMALAVNLARAQEATEVQQDYMYISVTHFFESTYLLSYEHFNTELDRSWHLSAGFIARADEERSKFGFMTTVQRRFYFIDPEIQKLSLHRGTFEDGIYFAPYFTYKYVKAENMDIRWDQFGERDTIHQRVSSNSVQAGLIVGFLFNISQVVYIDTYFGGGLHYPGKVTEHIWDFGVYPITYSGVMVKAGISAGIKF